MSRKLLKIKTNSLSIKLRDSEFRKSEFKRLEEDFLKWNQKAKEIQSKFDFILPNYIIDEIIENEEKKTYFNLYCLINCAVINGMISKKNEKMLKQVYYIT
ncbi:MAG: hypothetical protein HFJ42_04410 [Clostridia bacterium]|nr:hypothetical protein [Clostridia bacterium]